MSSEPIGRLDRQPIARLSRFSLAMAGEAAEAAAIHHFHYSAASAASAEGNEYALLSDAQLQVIAPHAIAVLADRGRFEHDSHLDLNHGISGSGILSPNASHRRIWLWRRWRADVVGDDVVDPDQRGRISA